MKTKLVGSNQHRDKHWLKPSAISSIYIVLLFMFILTLGSLVVKKQLKINFLQWRNANIIAPCGNYCETDYIPIVRAEEVITIDTTGFSTREIVIYTMAEHFGFKHLDELEHLLMGESSFNQYAVNPTSGACGIFQAYPCSKLKCELSDLDCQINWGVKYIQNRYGSPTEAYKFWLNQNPHWY